MFILFTGVQNTIRILETLFQKLDKLSQIKHKKDSHKTEKNHHDEFVEDQEEKNLLKSINELILLLLRSILGEAGAPEEFDEYLLVLQKELKRCASGNLESKLHDKGFRQNLEECLKEIFKYCLERKDKANCGQERAAWEKGMEALSIASALPTLTSIAKFLSIAKNSNFPPEVRSLAASLVNDALSHMKGQDVDNQSAKTLVALIGSTPDNVRALLYSALKDAKIIEKDTREQSNISSHRWYEFTTSLSGKPKRLTLA